MYSIAVIGDKDSVAGFGAVGLDVFFIDDQTECKRVFKQLVSSGKFAVIFITDVYKRQTLQLVIIFNLLPILV